MERGSVLFLVSVPGSGERQKGCFFMCHVSGAVSSLDFGAPIFFFISLFSLRASFCFVHGLLLRHGRGEESREILYGRSASDGRNCVCAVLSDSGGATGEGPLYRMAGLAAGVGAFVNGIFAQGAPFAPQRKIGR